VRKKAIPSVFDPSKNVNYRLDLLIQLLYDLSCHERSYVLRDITGECRVSTEYQERIANFLKIPQCTVGFWDIDYCIDWIYAALFLSQTEPTGSVYENVGNLIKGNNEDVDILLALRTENRVDLVMVEVKVEKPFSQSQLTSKVRRLNGIFGANGDKFPNIHPHWVLASPCRSRRIRTEAWPNWMTIARDEYLWYEMKKNFHSMKVTRCDSDGTPCKEGSHWMLEGRRGVKLSVHITPQERYSILQNVFVSDQVKIPLESLSSHQSTVKVSYSVPELLTIIHALSREAEQTDNANREDELWELHDRLSTLLHDEGIIEKRMLRPFDG